MIKNLVARIAGRVFISIMKKFPKIFSNSHLRRYITNNYNSGLVAVGERFCRIGAIGPQWIFVDINNCDKKIEFRAEKKLPFNDDSQRIIYSTHMIEHLTPESLESFIKDCFRILKPGGYLRFEAPCAETLITAYKNDDRYLIDCFNQDIINLIQALSLDKKYAENHVGILGILSCYIENGRHFPVYVPKKIFDKQIHSLSINEFAKWTETLQTEDQKNTNGHNNLIYYKQLEQICRRYGAKNCWKVHYGITKIPDLHLNDSSRQHKDSIIEGPHRIPYSIYFEAQK